MKKFITTIIGFVMLLSLASCGSKLTNIDTLNTPSTIPLANTTSVTGTKR